MDVVFLVFYFVGMLAIGMYYSSRQTTVEEYVTAGRGLGYWVATFSARTTGESGWLLLGLTGMGFAVGLSAFWVVLGEVLGVAVSWLWIIPRFKREVNHFGSLTMLDYFEDKLGDTRHYLRFIFTAILLVMVTAYIAAQITATGKAFHGFYGMNVHLAQVLGVGIILVYVILGGFHAVAVSDFIQGILMFLGLVGVPIMALIHIGGLDVLLVHLAESHPQLLNIFPQGNSGWIVFLAILGLAGPGLGFLGSPQVYQRIIALKPDANLKRASVLAMLYTLLTDGGAVLCGITGRYFFAELADVEAVFPNMVQHLFPALLVGLFVAIILSAIMSTVDSLLILASTTLVRDLYQKVINTKVSEKRAVFMLRVSTILISIFALIVASMEIRAIYWFALFGWAGIACAFCPPLILTLFWQRTNKYGVMAGALAGVGTAILWKTFSAPIIGFSLYEMVPGFAVSFIMTAIFSLITANRDSVDGSC